MYLQPVALLLESLSEAAKNLQGCVCLYLLCDKSQRTFSKHIIIDMDDIFRGILSGVRAVIRRKLCFGLVCFLCFCCCSVFPTSLRRSANCHFPFRCKQHNVSLCKCALMNAFALQQCQRVRKSQQSRRKCQHIHQLGAERLRKNLLN